MHAPADGACAVGMTSRMRLVTKSRMRDFA
jgi:hypothetical protein